MFDVLVSESELELELELVWVWVWVWVLPNCRLRFLHKP